MRILEKSWIVVIEVVGVREVVGREEEAFEISGGLVGKKKRRDEGALDTRFERFGIEHNSAALPEEKVGNPLQHLVLR